MIRFFFYSKLEMRVSLVLIVELVVGCLIGSFFFDVGIVFLIIFFFDESIEDVREVLLRYEDIDLVVCLLMFRVIVVD